jgi:hypothetical protein
MSYPTPDPGITTREVAVKALEEERRKLTNRIKTAQSERARANRDIAADKAELKTVERLLNAAKPRTRRTKAPHA